MQLSFFFERKLKLLIRALIGTFSQRAIEFQIAEISSNPTEMTGFLKKHENLEDCHY